MPPHSPGSWEGAAAFSYLVCGCQVAYAAYSKRCTAAVRYTLPPRRRREPALAELGHPEGASGRCSLTAPRCRNPLYRSEAAGAGLFPCHQIVNVGVGVENLRVIQLSKTRQVAVNGSSLSNSHIGKQYGVRVRDAVIVYRSRPAACRFVCGGDHSLSHQYSSFVGAHGCEACAKLSDRYRQYPLG